MTTYTMSPTSTTGGQMQTPELVEQILGLHQKGWGQKRISKDLGISRNTVRRYLRAKGWTPYRTLQKQKKLSTLEDWFVRAILKCPLSSNFKMSPYI